MKQLLENVRASAMELRQPRTLTSVSLLVAVGVIFGMIKIIPSDFLKFGLNFIVTASMGYLFGPVPALLGAGAVDLITFVLRPTGPYFVGFTLNAALSGAIYGLVLYRQRANLWRVLLAKGLDSLIVNCVLNTLWLSVLYGKSIAVLLPVRLMKNAVSLPVETAVLLVVLLGVGKAWSLARVART